ncbi:MULTISPECIES: DEAD/DEAH box helicase family protein [unclassified Mesorhizobium]|uniref:DEAD/DEAH box helicase n=1 Tax=unclassified Mesorhizobium TaxID=325217 RepID=UPI001FE0F3DF|nr:MULTISPECIES: DEAD/DEAH box helicase family protein [unclassified Mesorhizobium]
MLKLRPWQREAHDQAITWLTETRADRHFLINAAPGAGKTLATCAIAATLFERDEIDRVVVIAPRTEVVSQWAADFARVTGRHMNKATGADRELHALGLDVCATWSAVAGLQDAFQAICRDKRVLVVCDEHHHAAVRAAWGDGADNAFTDARYVIVLTGTPIRSDGAQSVWLAYDDCGAIDHPAEGTYTLTYGEAVDLGYCRPVTFHRHEGRFTVDLEDGEAVRVSSREKAAITGKLARIPALQRALNFYRLACVPQYEPGGRVPLATGYQASMVEWASAKLSDLRQRMPLAGGLVIAPSIEMAEYFVELIEGLEGERPMIVHSQMPGAENRIAAFRNTERRWIVSVAMISEGVDIRRLRVLVYLPHALTELAFRQAIGRVVRTDGPSDDTRAYVVMPSFERLEAYARRVEEEMSADARRDTPVRTKRCIVCSEENSLGASECSACGHEFPPRVGRFNACPDCGALNLAGAQVCQHCGTGLGHAFTLTLDEALRTGAIVRGMEIDEDAVRAGERIAPRVREMVLNSGDTALVRVTQLLPEESWHRLRAIFEDTA